MRDGDDDREHACDQTQMLEGDRQAIEDVDVGNVLEQRGSRRRRQIGCGGGTELAGIQHAGEFRNVRCPPADQVRRW